MATSKLESTKLKLKVSKMASSESVPASENIDESREVDKYDLSRWKYSELRDTINTSTDVELLECCRKEFHRRIKLYAAWKVGNDSKNDCEASTSCSSQDPNMVNETRPASKSVKQNYNSPNPSSSTTSESQRYFHIPLTKDGHNDGLWYAHFDGQLIARQMEIHPGRNVTLRISGRDDMQMCALKLSETGLAQKRGTEILECEFEKEWSKYGGERYIRPVEWQTIAKK